MGGPQRKSGEKSRKRQKLGNKDAERRDDERRIDVSQ
jgi:hypothetical protein